MKIPKNKPIVGAERAQLAAAVAAQYVGGEPIEIVITLQDLDLRLEH